MAIKTFTKIICKVCNKEMYSNSIGRHLKVHHNIGVQDYYDKYLLKSEDEKLCSICKKPVKFGSLLTGYYTMCNICSGKKVHQIYGGRKLTQEEKDKQRIKRESTCMAKYGVKSSNQDPVVRAKQLASTKKHYGTEFILHTPDIQDKIKATCKSKYGVENINQIPEHIQHIKETNLNKYGNICFLNSVPGKEVVNKTKIKKYGSIEEANKNIFNKSLATIIEKYGTDDEKKAFNDGKITNASEVNSIKEKIESTNLKKYGNKLSLISKDVMAKSNRTLKERYGIDNLYQSKEFQDKAAETNLKRYGCKSPLGNAEIKAKKQATFMNKYGHAHPPQKGKYIKDGYKFDSSWELFFYEYKTIIEHKAVNRNSTEYFEYEYQGVGHKCYPDFKIGNQFYEVKGPQFLDKDGNLINPFDSTMNDLNMVKGECFKNNNVIIVSKDDIVMMKEKLIDYYNDKNWYKKYNLQEETNADM